MRNLIIAAAACVAIAGCVTGPVTSLGHGEYLIDAHAYAGFGSHESVTERAAARADAFCRERGKVAHLRKTTGAGVVGITDVSADVVFTCLAREQH